MSDTDSSAGGTVDLTGVRAALRAELISRGLAVASDTLGMGREIYVMGDNDLADALFYFDSDAGEAAHRIYRGSGSWVDGMPARFVVLPASESDDPSVEMLEQMRTTPVFYREDAAAVTFPDLDELLTGRLG